jgi:uncharacterized membrane protein
MMIAVISIVLVVMMILFFAVTIAGGRAHDRQNQERAAKAELDARVPPLP